MTLRRALAAAQTVPVRGAVPENIEQHLQLAELARGAGAQIVVFPELSLTGYEMELARELAFDEADCRLAPLRDASEAMSLTLIVGAPVRIESRIHIGAFILAPDRTIAIHTKRRMGAFGADDCPGCAVPPPESSVFEPGSLRPLVRLNGTVAAVGICAESLRRSHAREAAERGANTYLVGHFGIPSDLALRHAVMRAHAEQHGMAVAFANYAGRTGGLLASGGSAMFSPAGDMLVQLGAEGAGVAVAIEGDAGWRTTALLIRS